MTIINPPPDLTDKQAVAEFYNFPLELLRGDYVGFNAISDPFWPKYEQELKYFLKNVAPLAKLVVCVTKFKIKDEIWEILRKIPNFRLNVSITGLDDLENTKTKDRLDVLRQAKKFGVKAFPIIHPYIAGLSDLSFLPELKAMGYDYLDVKGLRYNHQTMRTWMPNQAQQYYINSEEQEILPEDGWRQKIAQAGLTLKTLKDWYGQDCLSNNAVDEKTAENNVKKLLKYANITSSDTDEAVIKSAIERRL